MSHLLYKMSRFHLKMFRWIIVPQEKKRSRKVPFSRFLFLTVLSLKKALAGVAPYVTDGNRNRIGL